MSAASYVYEHKMASFEMLNQNSFPLFLRNFETSIKASVEISSAGNIKIMHILLYR